MYLKDVKNLGELIKWADDNKKTTVEVELEPNVFRTCLTQLKSMKGFYIDTSEWSKFETKFRDKKYILTMKQ